MNDRVITDRDLPTILGRIATSPYPAYVEGVLAVTSRQRQRPAWTFPGRWLPPGLTRSTRSVDGRATSLRAIVALVSLLVMLAIGWAIVAANPPEPKQPALPPPFGPARNGVIVISEGARFCQGGPACRSTLSMVDPLTGRAVPLDAGGWTVEPEFSNDGRRLRFSREGMTTVHVMNAEGSIVDVHGVEADPMGVWAPDGERVAVAQGRWLSIHDTARDDSVRYDLGFDVGRIQWRPNREQLLVESVAEDGTSAVNRHVGWFLVNADGTDLTPVRAAWGVWSPDGSTLAYGTGGRVHLLDIDGGEDRELRFAGSDRTIETPVAFSPDGTRILITRSTDVARRYPGHAIDPRCGNVNKRTPCAWFRHVIVPTVGRGPEVVLGSADHQALGGSGSRAIFSPDGSQVLAVYTYVNAGMWLFDAATGRSQSMPWYGGGQLGGLTWQRLAP